MKPKVSKTEKDVNTSAEQLMQSPELHSEGNFPIVGIASSAGGITALRKFFTHVPTMSGIAFVVIQHQESTCESMLVESLQQLSSMKVFQAQNQMKVDPNCIYVIPPVKDLEITDGKLYLINRPLPRKLHLPADYFFKKLAEDQGEFAVGIVLSGLGVDGTSGLQAIKKNNGWAFAQEPSSCEFESMPKSAIDSGIVDANGLVEDLPGLIITKLKHGNLIKMDKVAFDRKKQRSNLSKIVDLLFERTGHQFTQYKDNTLYRRIERRMKECNVDNIDAYVQLLHENTEETDALFKELLINVTHFFRDPEIWKHLTNISFPSLLSKCSINTELRAWVPACSTGEEAYSLAMSFIEALDQTKLKEQFTIKIFATDLDNDVIKKARKGLYPPNIAEHVSPERLSRFFIESRKGYRINDEIRELIVFAEHNIISDAPFSRLDLVSCRNLLIYFKRELQENLLPLIHYGLNPDGLLLLGTAETIGRFNDLFTPVDIKWPIYKANNNSSLRQAYLNFPSNRENNLKQSRNKSFLSKQRMNSLVLPSQHADLQNCTPVSLMLRSDGEIICVSNDANTKITTQENTSNLPDKITLGSLITELQMAREETHAAYEEMQTSQEELRSSNEELRATNEDLHHSNIKLQSTNEKLTDSKLDLLFTNDQLTLANNKLNTYIQAIGKLALVSVADRSGKITEANEQFCVVSGYSEEELIGQDHRILNSEKHPKSFFIAMWQDIASGHIWHKEICNRKKSGELYWVDSTIVPLKDHEGQIVRYISIRVDISARKVKELQLLERLKERSCLYAIHRDMVRESSPKKLCNKVIKHLLLAMSFPKEAACKIQLNHEFFFSKNYRDDLSHQISAKIKVKESVYGRLQVFYTKDISFVLPDDQNLINFVAEDLSLWCERNQHDHHIKHMASHDVLTGLPNRLLLQDRITQSLEFNQRHHGMAAVLFIDLDNFKNINDTFGHDTGDILLKNVGARLLSSIRSEDTVARQGGDEFIVVLPHFMEDSVVMLVVQKILDQLSEPFQVVEHEFHVTCSIGIALYPEHGKDANTLLKHSDTAMYCAKTSGRNTYRYFTEDMNHESIENHKLTSCLRTAVRNNQLSISFQQITDKNGNLSSLEALLRWQDAEHGLISPSKFIPLAEESGLILALGEWVIRSVCLQIRKWQNEGYDAPRIAINISAKQFQQKLFIEKIQNILTDTGITAQHLILEITESMLMESDLKVTKTLNQLSDMGLTLAIDDFGTGYSSLSYLKHYPIDILKIDRSFIKDIISDDNDAAIVTATIAMAHSLGIKVIAEGIETKKQLNFLAKKGCDLYQGFYFSKPAPDVEVERLLKKTSVKSTKTE